MPSRSEIHERVSSFCRELFDRRRSEVADLSRVSDVEQAEVSALAQAIGRIQLADPFPHLADGHWEELGSLHQRLNAEGGGAGASRHAFLEWANLHFPPSSPAPASAPEFNAVAPGNARMIVLLNQFKVKATSARLRLLRAGDAPDSVAFKRARNSFTLARAAYVSRLEAGTLDATPELNVEFERAHLAALEAATGERLPQQMSAAADFARAQVFGPETFVA